MSATSTRRAILAGAAAIPALSLPAIAAPDPIFAAIESHRQAEAAFWSASDEVMEDGRFEELGDTSLERLDALLPMTPTTVAGCAAMLRHVEGYLQRYDHPLFNDWDDLKCGGNTLLSRIAAIMEASGPHARAL